MHKQNKNLELWIGGAAVLVLVIVAGLLVMFTNTPGPVQVTTGPSQTGTEPASVQDISAQDTGTAAVNISYSDALAQYATRRIQLDKNCAATPNSVTYKDNTGIMIDNRSPETRTVKVGSSFTIKPWGFKIVVLPDIAVKPSTLLVDCDMHQNVATILVQE
ncbi:hypothetical protein KW786_02175 [Candidatus Parcubacteria bacterium]|nr:hypothetical protein [Candidatus Parcubacteria bacterium]